MRIQVTTSYLEMTEAKDLRPVRRPDGLQIEVKRSEIPSPELNRFLYTAVGGDWNWRDKLVWTYQEWLEVISLPGFQTWVIYVSGTPAGYFELNKDDEAGVEIVSFGLLPQFTERGLGGFALSVAVKKAWSMGARRIWLHTWSLDHPNALTNYLARGFAIYREEKFTIERPRSTPGPWPGARARRRRRGFDWRYE
jgi:GNAT superfamily N-acetyltransferase